MLTGTRVRIAVLAAVTYAMSQSLVMSPALAGVSASTPVATSGVLGIIPVSGTQELRVGGAFDLTQGSAAQVYSGLLTLTVNYD